MTEVCHLSIWPHRKPRWMFPGSMTIAYEEPRHVGQRCIGKPANDTEFRIVDEDDADVTAGESGELLVRASGDNPRRNFFSGYYKDDAATDAGWQGGWWHTGDIVREGSDGSLFFVDRRKNVSRSRSGSAAKRCSEKLRGVRGAG